MPPKEQYRQEPLEQKYKVKKNGSERREGNTTKSPKESLYFTDWNSFSKREKFKELPILTREYMHFKVMKISDNRLRKMLLIALSNYINKYGNINTKTFDYIDGLTNARYIEDKIVSDNSKNQEQLKKAYVKVKEVSDSVVGFIAGTAKRVFSKGKSESTNEDSTDMQQNVSNSPNKNSQETGTPTNKPSTSEEKKRNTMIEQQGKKEIIEQINNIPDQKIQTWFKRNLDKLLNEPEILEGLVNGVESGGMTLKLRFVKEKNPEFGSYKDFEEAFQKRNNERLKDIQKLFNVNIITIFANKEQTKKDPGLSNLPNRLAQSSNPEDFTKKVTESTVGETEEYAAAIELCSSYTKSEMIGEYISTHKLDNYDSMYLLQILISAYLDKENVWDESTLDGKWNPDTQKFLEDLLVDPEFKNDPNSQNYVAAINNVLQTQKPHYDTSKIKSKYESFSESVNRDKEYRKDPEAFRRKQTLEGPRGFAGITNNLTFSGGDSYKEGEKAFLKENMKEFNSKISNFLSLPKLEDGVTPNEETKTKMDKIWKAIPLKQLNSLYENFANNPDEQQKLQEYLKNNNLPDIKLNDISLKTLVLNKNLSLNPAAEYCYNRIWICLQDQLTSEAGKTLQYLSDKTGDTAFNIKNKVLEFFLPGISIHPEKTEDGVFYFRDENNLDTLYGFTPEDGNIIQKENISMGNDGTIRFGSEGAEGNTLTKIKNFQDIINIELGDILPDKNASDVDELEKQIAKKIEGKISINSVGVDTSIVGQSLLRKENEKNVCRDRIVGDMKYLLDIRTPDLHENAGENYRIFRSLLKTFDKIKMDSPNDNTSLVSMKDFFDKVYTSASQGTLLKPTNGENIEEVDNENNSQEGQHGGVEKQPQEMWKTLLLKNLIDPQTQLFDIKLITMLANDSEVNDYLAKRDFNNVLGKIAKQKDLQELDRDTKNKLSKLDEETSSKLKGLYEETQLYASIDALEKEGEILS